MATVQDIDGLLLTFNAKFLSNLEGEKYVLSQMRFKFQSNIGLAPMYRSFSTIAEFRNFYSNLLNDPNVNCLTGRFPILESIKLANNKLTFSNSYYARVITSGVRVQTDYKLDNYRDTSYKRQVELYKKYLLTKFTNYMIDINNLISFRKNLHIESCWIDPDYFKSTKITLLTV